MFFPDSAFPDAGERRIGASHRGRGGNLVFILDVGFHDRCIFSLFHKHDSGDHRVITGITSTTRGFVCDGKGG